MKRSRTLYGIDGCKSGWLVVSQPIAADTVSVAIHCDIASFANSVTADDIVVIDMPIGLPKDTMDDNASRPPQSQRFRRDRLTLERRAGAWLRDFSIAAAQPGFSVSEHLELSHEMIIELTHKSLTPDRETSI